MNVTRADRDRLDAIVSDRSAPQKHVWRANIILATLEGCGTAEIMRRSGKSKPRGVEMAGGILVRPIKAATGCEFEAATETGRVMQTGSDLGYEATTTGDLPWHPESNILTHKSPCEPDPGPRTHPTPASHGVRLHRGGHYQRHGTTTLFAALNVLDGAVIAQCKPRHRHQEFLAFLRHIEANVPAQLDIHLVVDNYATHKHPKVQAWLARRPRWHIHFTPTYASWLNQVERFFALITQRAIRRGSFDSTADLVKKIDRFIRTHNANSRPFVWTATADSILQKLARLCQRISGTEH